MNWTGKAYGRELDFISRIHRDGKGVSDVFNVEHLANTQFHLISLSITQGTYVASEFNSYVVRLKSDTAK